MMQKPDGAKFSDRPLLNKRETAEYLGVSISTLENLMHDGLPYIRFSDKGAAYFRPIDIDKFLESKVRVRHA